MPSSYPYAEPHQIGIVTNGRRSASIGARCHSLDIETAEAQLRQLVVRLGGQLVGDTPPVARLGYGGLNAEAEAPNGIGQEAADGAVMGMYHGCHGQCSSAFVLQRNIGAEAARVYCALHHADMQ
jgi:hypothetical protein